MIKAERCAECGAYVLDLTSEVCWEKLLAERSNAALVMRVSDLAYNLSLARSLGDGLCEGLAAARDPKTPMPRVVEVWRAWRDRTLLEEP